MIVRSETLPLVILAIASAGIALTGIDAAGASERYLPVRGRPEVLLPPDTDALAWRYHMKMGTFSCSNAGQIYELNTPDLVERRLTEMQEEGFNTIIMNGLHMHNNFLERWPMVTRYVKQVTTSAHRRGMKVIFHHDVPVLDYHGRGLHELVAHPDWLQRDIEHDRPTFRAYCINNPGFRKAYFNRMKTFVQETDIDGVMLDEANFSGKEFCGGPHCRRAFTQDTGLVLPRNNTSDVFYNKNHPVWAAWLQWRKRSVGDWWVALRKVFNEVKRNFVIMIYSTHYGFTSYWAPLSFGSDLVEYARGCDFLGTEIMARNVYDYYRAVYSFRKAMAGLGQHLGSPIWGLVYHVDDPNFAYFGWAMNHMNRQTTWMSSIEGEDMGRYLDWPDRMKSRFAGPVSDVAIMFSTATRDFGKMMSWKADTFGVSQCLVSAHIQHDFILDNDLLDAQKLDSYKLLILASIGNLSGEQVRAVRKYVKGGGAVLVSGHTSLLNETGSVQENFQLADVIGVDFAGKVPGVSDILIKTNGTAVTIPETARVRVRLRQGAEALGEIVGADENTVSPAIVANRYGSGHAVYVAFQPGYANYHRERRGRSRETFEVNQPAADLLVRLVRETANGSFDTRAVEVPAKVLMRVHRQEANGESSLLVHLLNATGAGVEKGEMIPLHKNWNKAGGPFPPSKKDLVFDIRAGQVARGYITSPDYQERRPVNLEQREDGYLRVTVSKEDLKAYGIVYLVPGKAEKK